MIISPSSETVAVLHSAMVLMQQVSHVLVAAAAIDERDVKPYAGPLGFGVIFVVMGALAYSGKWRSWSSWRALSVYRVLPIALGWAGVGNLVLAVANVLPEPLAEIVGFPAMAFVALCILGMVWLPRFMLPRWYRIQKGAEREALGSARRGVTPERGALLSSSGAGGGVVPPVGGASDAAFAARIGGSVGGVGVADA